MHMQSSNVNGETVVLTVGGPIGRVSGRLIPAGARRLVLGLREVGASGARTCPQATLGVCLDARRQLTQSRRQLVRVAAHGW
jgi:hypothetical protein